MSLSAPILSYLHLTDRVHPHQPLAQCLSLGDGHGEQQRQQCGQAQRAALQGSVQQPSSCGAQGTGSLQVVSVPAGIVDQVWYTFSAKQ
jgi:hypothetical protein